VYHRAVWKTKRKWKEEKNFCWKMTNFCLNVYAEQWHEDNFGQNFIQVPLLRGSFYSSYCSIFYNRKYLLSCVGGMKKWKKVSNSIENSYRVHEDSPQFFFHVTLIWFEISWDWIKLKSFLSRSKDNGLTFLPEDLFSLWSLNSKEFLLNPSTLFILMLDLILKDVHLSDGKILEMWD